MVQMRIAAAVVLALGLMAANLGLARDDKKPDATKDKLTGVWQFTKGEGLPPGAVVEFSKDSKLKITFSKPDVTVINGTWSVDGTDLKITMNGPGGKDSKETMKIVELTDTKLVTKDDKDKLDEFKKVVTKTPTPK